MRRLWAKDLQKTFKQKRVVCGIDLEVRSKEIVGLLGPNGAGKTTTFYMVAGLIRPDAGKIFLDEEDLTPLSLAARAKRGLTYLPQERSLFRDLTVEKNILAVLEVAGFPRKERQERKERLLEEFELVPLAENLARTLSGGEARRVEIARAVAIKPDFILLDEPFAGVDPVTVSQLQSLLKELRQKGMGILISDHNVRETLKVCDRAYIMHRGEILASGTPEEIAANEKVRETYLGADFSL